MTASDLKTLPEYPFPEFKKTLDFFGFPYVWSAAGSDSPYDLLVVDGRSDPELPELPVQLLFADDVLKTVDPSLEQTTLPLAESLVFHITLSHAVPEERVLELAALLNAFNRAVPYGGAALQPGQPIAIRYPLLSHTRYVHPLLVLRVIKTLAFFTERLRPCLERLAEEAVPAPQLIEQFERSMGRA